MQTVVTNFWCAQLVLCGQKLLRTKGLAQAYLKLEAVGMAPGSQRVFKNEGGPVSGNANELGLRRPGEGRLD